MDYYGPEPTGLETRASGFDWLWNPTESVLFQLDPRGYKPPVWSYSPWGLDIRYVE